MPLRNSFLLHTYYAYIPDSVIQQTIYVYVCAKCGGKWTSATCTHPRDEESASLRGVDSPAGVYVGFMVRYFFATQFYLIVEAKKKKNRDGYMMQTVMWEYFRALTRSRMALSTRGKIVTGSVLCFFFLTFTKTFRNGENTPIV